MHFKAKVCLTCGDAGFPEALVYCIKCKSCAVHRYCLPTVILRSDVDWLCDDCEPRIPIAPAFRETGHATLRDRGGKSQERNRLDDRIVNKKTRFSGAAESSFQEAADFREIKSNEAPTLKVRTLDRGCCKDVMEEQLAEKNGLVGTLSNEANTSYTRASMPPGFKKYVEAQQNEVSIWRGDVSISRVDSDVACCQEAANFQGTESHDTLTMEVPTLDIDCRNGSKKERQLEQKNGLVGMPTNEANTSSTRASIPPGFEKYVEAQQNEVSIWRGDVSISREDSDVACCQEAANFQGTERHDTPTMEVPTLDIDCRNGSKKERQLEPKNGLVGMPSNEANTSYTRASIPSGFEKYVEAQQNEVSIRRQTACVVKMKKNQKEKLSTKRTLEKINKKTLKQGKKRAAAKKMRLVCRPSCIMHINESLLNHRCLNDRKKREALIDVAGFGFLLLMKHGDPSPKGVKEVFNFLNGEQKFLVPEDHFRQMYGLNFGNELMDLKGGFSVVPRARFKNEMEQFEIPLSRELCVKAVHIEDVLLRKKKINNYDWVKLYIFYALGVFIAPRISKVIPGYYWSYLEQISQVRRYNWAKFMADDLNAEVLLTLDKFSGSSLVKMGGNTCALVEYFNQIKLRSNPRVPCATDDATGLEKWSKLSTEELYKVYYDLIQQQRALETSKAIIEKIIKERKVTQEKSEAVDEMKNAPTDDEHEDWDKIMDEHEEAEQAEEDLGQKEEEAEEADEDTRQEESVAGQTEVIRDDVTKLVKFTYRRRKLVLVADSDVEDKTVDEDLNLDEQRNMQSESNNVADEVEMCGHLDDVADDVEVEEEMM